MSWRYMAGRRDGKVSLALVLKWLIADADVDADVDTDDRPTWPRRHMTPPAHRRAGLGILGVPTFLLRGPHPIR
jgi:hypothetical protein